MDTRQIKEEPVQRTHDQEHDSLTNRAHEITQGGIPQNDDRYRDVLESIKEGYYELDLKGSFTFVTDAACALMGYEYDELIGMNYKSYTSPETARRMYEMFHRIFETGKSEIMVDYEVICKDKSVVTHEMKASLLRDTSGQPRGYWILVWDLTEYKKKEDVLRKTEEQYRNILDSIEEAYFEVDLKGNLTFFNSTAVRRFGCTKEEMMGMNFRQFVDEENAEKVFNAYHKVYLTGETIKAFEWEFINKSGEKLVVEASVSLLREENGSPRGFRGIVRDISDRKKAEAAQRESEEKYRSILENIEEGYYEVDLKGNFTFFNDPICQMLGYSQEEIMGMNYGRIMDEECMLRVYNIFHNVFLTGKADKGFDCVFIGKDGSISYIESSVTLIRDSKGEPAGFRGIVHDITEKKSIEQQLMRAQKMEAIGTLAGGIAHDFNNLLMGIIGNVSLMLVNIGESNPLFSRLKIIEEYVQHGADLTKQLLGFARGGKYEIKPTHIGEFVRRSSDLFGRTKKEICIHVKDQKGLWVVEVDRGQMDQVLLNLYVNAWQAMPGGGEIYVSVENVELDEMYVSPYEVNPGKFVKVTVTDTGIGMDEETRARIFEPFFTTKELGRGTGLGLATVYGIIRNHGGFICVESKKDFGTSFMIHLPASERHVIKEYADTDKKQQGHETVLLIDDEKMILDIGTELLESLGYKVMKASGGEQGLQIFEQKKETVDLVILDMVMPGFSGKETFDALKCIDPCVKVLLSSGYSLDGQAKEIMLNGCNGFIQKPYTMLKLSKKIRGVLDE